MSVRRNILSDLPITSAMKHAPNSPRPHVEMNLTMLSIGSLLCSLTLGFAICSTGCLKKSALFCDENTPCTDPDRPFCDLTGEFPDSEGIGKTCIANPFPDAGTPDANSGRDADTSVPPLVNGQFADLVLGQANFTSSAGLADPAASLVDVYGVASDGTRLWARTPGRVYQWNSLPTSNGQAASIAVGAPDFTSTPAGPTVAELEGAVGNVASDGQRLLVTDLNRVVIWDPLPSSTGTDAFQVLGQLTFDSNAESLGAGGFRSVRGVWSDGVKLATAESVNSRVQLWDSFPTSSGQAADRVIGQPGFGAIDFQNPPTRSSMVAAESVHFDGQRLYVADYANSRVLIWNSWPTTDGQAADVIVGHANGESRDCNRGGAAGANTLCFPISVTTARGSLFVADGNNRILLYNPIPTSDGVAASVVLGQDNFSDSDSPDPMSPQPNRFFPLSMATDGNALWVTDSNPDRVLRFTFQN